MVRPKQFSEKIDNFDELVSKDFTAYKRKINPGYEDRRFDGYCAIHHRVKFADNPVESHSHATIEIQVCPYLCTLGQKWSMTWLTRKRYGTEKSIC